MEFRNERFVTGQAGDLQKFGIFLGKPEAMSLVNEIKDESGSILVQAQRPLKSTILKSLVSREEAIGPRVFELETSDDLRKALAHRFYHDTERYLKTLPFALAAHLLDKKNVSLLQVVTSAMQNNFFLGYAALAMYEDRNNLEHLFQVSLTSVALLVQIHSQDFHYSELVTMLQAGFLHDIALKTPDRWKNEDVFGPNCEHEHVSSRDIGDPALFSAISGIINGHHSLEQKYINATLGDSWASNQTDLQAAILLLVEFFTYAKRVAEQESSGGKDPVSPVVYQLSLQAEKGFLPKPLVHILETFFRKYAHVFHYAQQVGEVENLCPHHNLALAYPKPKATQILCKDDRVECPHRLYGQPLNVISGDSDSAFRLGENLKKGWYEKCQFSGRLPVPPADL